MAHDISSIILLVLNLLVLAIGIGTCIYFWPRKKDIRLALLLNFSVFAVQLGIYIFEFLYPDTMPSLLILRPFDAVVTVVLLTNLVIMSVVKK